MELTGKVEALCIKDSRKRFPQSQLEMIELSLEGPVGDVHSGFTRPADGRDRGIKRGTPLRNWRQWSAVSLEELALIATRLGVPEINPTLLSANFTFSGIPSLTLIPKGSTVHFEGGVILTVEGENEPCVLPGKQIALNNPDVNAHDFVKAALKRRGIVGVVHKAGVVRNGEHFHIRLYESASHHMFGNPAQPFTSR